MTTDARLTALEKESRKLDPGPQERSVLMEAVFRHAQDYLETIPEAPAYSARADGRAGVLDAPISEAGIGLERALSIIANHVDSVGINTTSGRFLGYVPGGALFYSALGDFLAAVSNRYAGVYFASPGATRIENQLVAWMGDVVGYPNTCNGYLSAGGSQANLTALVTARDQHGIEGAMTERSVVYLTEHAHHCVEKALDLIGLRKGVRRFVPVDNRYRMIPERLDEQIGSDKRAGLHPWVVVASAGTTNTGSVDPLKAIADVASAHGLWYHIDGAYGGFFTLCPEGRNVLTGMESSDSLVIDPHKTLFLPYGTGALLVRDGDKLLASHRMNADYMQDIVVSREDISPADLSPELTKHFRGLRLWLPLQVLGVAPFRAALSEKILLARRFHEKLSTKKGFEVGPYPELSIVTYRYVPTTGDADAFNRRLLRRVYEDGRIFLSSTQLDGRFALRMAAVSFRTHKADVDEAVDILCDTVRRVEEE